MWEEKTIYEYELMQYEIQFPHSYSKSEKQIVSEGTTPEFELDDLYEAKAHKWMLKNIDKNQNTLFWCVGRRLTSDEVEHICTG